MKTSVLKRLEAIEQRASRTVISPLPLIDVTKLSDTDRNRYWNGDTAVFDIPSYPDLPPGTVHSIVVDVGESGRDIWEQTVHMTNDEWDAWDEEQIRKQEQQERRPEVSQITPPPPPPTEVPVVIPTEAPTQEAAPTAEPTQAAAGAPTPPQAPESAPPPVQAPAPAPVQQVSPCASFDAWEWAQSVFESDPTTYNALDPDVDGIACLQLPAGFAPAFWTDTIPADVQQAEVVRLIDGDTLEVKINGVSNRIRIYRADTPETQNEKHCGGAEATAFAEWALSWNETPGIVYIEKDKNERDRYGRELGYVWFEVDGNPYMLNHILINNGWAEDVDYADRKYDLQLKDAAAFADRHDLGVWALCGGFGLPVSAAAVPPTTPGRFRCGPGSGTASRSSRRTDPDSGASAIQRGDDE